MSRPAVAARHEIGVHKLMWGTDYPHDEGTFPYSKQVLRHTFHDVAEAEYRRIFGGTIAGLYDFDLEALTVVAERVGPKPSLIHTPLPLEEIPIDTKTSAFSMQASSGLMF